MFHLDVDILESEKFFKNIVIHLNERQDIFN